MVMKIVQKKFLLFGLLCGISSFSLVHAYRVRLINETQYPCDIHVINKTILCRNIHRSLQPGESHEENNGWCNVKEVTGEVFVKKTTSKFEGIPEYQKFIAIPYEPPFGRTGTKLDTYAIIQKITKYGPPVFEIVRR